MCLGLSPAALLSHVWFASHLHYSGMCYRSLLSLRETCLVCIPSSSDLGNILKISALLAGLKKKIKFWVLGLYVFQFTLYNRNMAQSLGCYL